MDNIQEYFDKLIAIYKANLAQRELIERTLLAEESFSHDENLSLILKIDQAHIKYTLINLLADEYKKRSNKGSLSTEYITNLLKKYVFKVLNAKLSSKHVCKELIQELMNIKLKKFTFMVPVAIVLDSTEPIKIIDIKLIVNPLEYLRNSNNNSNSFVSHDINKYFLQPAPYNNALSVGALGDIEAIDLEDAKNKFKKLTGEAAGLIKLFYPGHVVRFFNSQAFTSEISFHSEGDYQNKHSWSFNFSNSNMSLPYITQDYYCNKMRRYISWLDDLDHEKIKIKKMKDALYWYNYATDEENLTNKFIYLITVLETLLKNNNEKSEVATTIADRVTFLLYIDSPTATKIAVNEKIKKIYAKRSKIIHSGSTLDIEDKTMIDSAYYYVKHTLHIALEELSDPTISFNSFIKSINEKKFGK